MNVSEAYSGAWLSPVDDPKAVLSDNGGEFNAEFSEELGTMGVKLLRATA